MWRTKPAFAVLLLLSLLLAACGAPATTQAPATSNAAVSAPASQSTESAASTAASAAASAAASTAAAPADGKPVVVAQTDIADQLDPMFNSALNASSQFEMMFDSLIAFNDKLELTPALATEWAVDDAGTTWTFKLRDDVKFWDGTPLTADDVKYTIDRMTDPKVGATGNTQYLSNNMQVASVAVVDPTTVTITTKSPVPALPTFIHEVGIMSKAHYSALSNDDAAKTPMGSGPFEFVEFIKDDRVVMRANESWWNGAPAIKEIVWRKIPEASTRIAELVTGGVDIATALPVAKFAEVQDAPGTRLESVVGGCRMTLGMKHSNPLFQDKRVRQALNYAIDWETINAAIFEGTAPRMVVNVNPPWLNESLTAYTYDVEKAKSLLAEAGWTDSDGDGTLDKDGQPLAPKVLVYYDATSDRYEVITAIIDMYRKAGINAEIVPSERSVAVDQLINKTYDDMYFIGSCSSFEGQGDISDLEAASVSNYGGWNNADFQAKFEQLRGTFEPEQRATILDEMQQIVYDEAPLVFLYRLVDNYGISERLSWTPSASGRINLATATLK